MTAFNSKTGGFQLTTVGRVQTPTLAIVVEREENIRRFVPRDYCELHATFAAKAGEYVGRWFDEKFSKDKKEATATSRRSESGTVRRPKPSATNAWTSPARSRKKASRRRSFRLCFSI